ncbi:MAG: hypothetical protein ACK5VA_05020 [Pseudanabaena sp.]
MITSCADLTNTALLPHKGMRSRSHSFVRSITKFVLDVLGTYTK